MQNNISNVSSCYGCGVCSIACPKRIIDIEPDKNGFYVPVITDAGSCIQCGICRDVCAYLDDIPAENGSGNTDYYAAYSNDPQIRKACSSGGIGFEIGRHLIGQGYKACGVRYDAEEKRAVHYIADNSGDFSQSIGSKYIPSYTLPGFSQLNRNERFFVTGTPCQIDSLRRYIRKTKTERNYVLMDFFCHGVPSLNMWRKYAETVGSGIGEPAYFSWRDKKDGWHNSYVMTAGNELPVGLNRFSNDKYRSSMHSGDIFYKFFLGNICLGKACYDKCKYKMSASAADIRIGDLWGNTYRNDTKGVSALLVLTDKGREALDGMNNCSLKRQPAEIVMEGQMKRSPYQPYFYNQIMRVLGSERSLQDIYRLVRLTYMAMLPLRALRKLGQIFNRIYE